MLPFFVKTETATNSPFSKQLNNRTGLQKTEDCSLDWSWSVMQYLTFMA